jgi:hypothetical protein
MSFLFSKSGSSGQLFVPFTEDERDKYESALRRYNSTCNTNTRYRTYDDLKRDGDECKRIKNIAKDMNMDREGTIHKYQESRVDKALQKELNLLNTLIDKEIQNGYRMQQPLSVRQKKRLQRQNYIKQYEKQEAAKLAAQNAYYRQRSRPTQQEQRKIRQRFDSMGLAYY